MNKRYTYKYTKRFHNCLNKIIQLTTIEIILLEWLAEEMSEENKVHSNEETRKKFINFIVRISNEAGEIKSYKDSYIKLKINKLKSMGFLIAPLGEKRGWFWVNPLYYFKGNIAKRDNLISHIENRVGDLI